MSRIGGPNEIASLSIGVTVDQAALQASLAQTKATVEQFNKTVVVQPGAGGGVGPGGGVVGPGINPTGGMYDPAHGFVGPPSSHGPFVGPPKETPSGPGGSNIIGPGGVIIPQLDAAKDKFKQTKKEADGFFEGIGRNLREQAAPWRFFNQSLRQTQQAIFGLVGTFGAFAAALAGVFSIGKSLGDFFADTEAAAKDLKKAVDEAAESVDRFTKARNVGTESPLQAAGLSSEQVEEVQRRAARTQKELAELESARPPTDDTWLEKFIGGILGGPAGSSAMDGLYEKKLREMRGRAADASTQLSETTDRGRDTVNRAVSRLSASERARAAREGIRFRDDYSTKLEDANRAPRSR